jgi:hypothetical protein
VGFPSRRNPMSILKFFMYAVVLIFSFLLLLVRYVAA